MRLDKWLWTARLFKTRALAAEAVSGGRVHVNGAAVKPSREVRMGDEFELRRLGGPVDLGGRPSKRDRRRFDAGRRS
ncbi:MAG TPA: S4 domain-containing protein [Solirubrobacteraceae bacterium]|nr:S4 domain-containing protein [Solirubrobacteraceae bacterium]